MARNLQGRVHIGKAQKQFLLWDPNVTGLRPWVSSPGRQGPVCQDLEHDVRESEVCKSDVGSISLKIL